MAHPRIKRRLLPAAPACSAKVSIWARPAWRFTSFEDGKLTLAGNEPGNPQPPASFDAPGADCLELTRH